MNNKRLDTNLGSLKAVLKISWFILPLLVIQLFFFYTTDYEIERFQLVIIYICILFFTSLNFVKKAKFLKQNFYQIQVLFLITLVVFEFLWYTDNPGENQLFSFILGITITGLAMLKPKNTILYFVALVISLIIVNSLTDYHLFNNVNYFIISAVCITAFNIWRANIFKKLQISKQSYVNLFNASQALIFVVKKSNYEILEYNSSAADYINNKQVKGQNFLEVFTCENEIEDVRNHLENIQKNEDKNQRILETTCKQNRSEYDPKEFHFKQTDFFNEEVIIITVKLIKERKEKERQIEESKQNITQILDNINSFVYNISLYDNGDKGVRFVSKKAEDILKTELDELVFLFKRNKIKDFIHPDDIEFYKYKMKQANETLKPQIIEYRIIIDDEVSWIEEKVFSQRDNDCILRFGIITDITNEKTAELKLISSEQKYRRLYEESLAGFFKTNLNGEILEANIAFANILGVKSVEELKKKNIKDFYFTDFDRENYLNELKRQKALRNYIVILKKVDGSRVIVSNNVFYVTIDGESHITGTLIDVTELHETTEALKQNQLELIQSQDSFKNIVDSSPAALLIFNDQEELVFLNRLGQNFYDTYLNNSSKLLNEIFDKKHRFIIENVMNENADSTQSYTEVIFGEGTTQKKFVFQVVKVMYNNNEANLLLFRDITLEQEYNTQKLRAELAEDLNTNLEQEILRHKETQKLLIQNTKFTENVLDSSLDMIIASDNNRLITAVNSASLKRLGYTRDELLGQDIEKIYANTDNAQEVFDAINDTEKYIGEIENIEKNGNKFKSFLSATTIKNNEGQIVGYMGVSRDLSEIDQIKKIISDQGSLIESLFKNETNVFIWVINKEMNLVSFNDSTNNYFKHICNNDLQKGENFLDQINQSIRPKHIKTTKEIYQNALNGEKIEFEALMSDKHGQKYWIDVHLSPIILPNGEIEEVVCLGHDITDKKIRTTLIEENESNLRAVIKAIPDMIFKVSKTGEIIDYEVNSEEQKVIIGDFLDKNNSLFGVNIRDLFSKSSDHLFLDKMIELINKVIKTEAVLTQNFEYPINNSLTHFENRYSKVNNNEAIIVVRNRTEEIENEQKLMESLHEKEVLLKEVHHRVKNNLQIINSILNLQSSYVSDDKTLEIINESQNRIRSMAYIHESLYQTNNFSSINFKDYIENLINNLIYSYQIGDNIRLIKKIEPMDLALDQAIPCGLILNEIITNALKYAYQPEEKGDIIIDISLVNNKIEIIVEDFGSGLPPNFNIETSESLGLSLVHTLVDQIDGELIVKSNDGTKFLIIFEKLES